MSDRIDEYHGDEAKVLTTDEVERWQEFLGDGIQLSRTLATTRALETAQAALVDVHDALHRECAGKADLPGEIRALRARAEKAERERDEARTTMRRWESEQDQTMLGVIRQRDEARSEVARRDALAVSTELMTRAQIDQIRSESKTLVSELETALEAIVCHWDASDEGQVRPGEIDAARAVLAKAKGAANG